MIEVGDTHPLRLACSSRLPRHSLHGAPQTRNNELNPAELILLSKKVPGNQVINFKSNAREVPLHQPFYRAIYLYIYIYI